MFVCLIVPRRSRCGRTNPAATWGQPPSAVRVERSSTPLAYRLICHHGERKDPDQLVQDFVESLNLREFESQAPDDLPIDLRGPASTAMPDWFTWKISPSTLNPWTAEIEEKLPRRYPEVYRRLIRNYRFSYFEVGPMMFFANTGQPVFYELARRIFADKTMSPFLIHNGYLQFGKVAGGGYDPVCFAPRGLNDKRESCIVRLDHEEILIKNGIKVILEVSPSIEEFMERTINGDFEIH